ncbi:sec-independent protein translocase protein TATC, chloroplastic isoform X2 [Phalaenopsis equestris]|uniref:sec-independent protein translocase protein TATC, chloroplastic isoform X2 n=1 Tax=Phalaenopsis equestris TaxID=78828 RepID=UPI0009E3A840|nr:sec-independent protein translocase protein TATC, chloroplastic isoform X2 [Phalaenopsis equestris]
MGSSALLSSAHLTSCSGRPQFIFWRCEVRRSGGGAIPCNSISFRSSKKQHLLCFALEEDGGREVQQSPPTSGTGAALQEKPIETSSLKDKQIENRENEQGALYNFLYPSKELLPDDKEMSIFDHLEELRDRIFVSVLAVGGAIIACFAFSKDLIKLLEAPVAAQGVRFLQLSPGEFFFTTLKVSGYCGLLLGSPVILYEIIAFVLPGLTKDERRFLGPIVLGSSVLFYAGIIFSYAVLAPAALNFFVNYAEGAVESLWSIDQYFEFVLILLFSTGLSFQVPVIQLLLGQLGLVSGDQMLSIWRYVVVGAVVAAAVLTPSTDPLTQVLLAGPLMCLYLGGAWMVKLIGR